MGPNPRGLHPNHTTPTAPHHRSGPPPGRPAGRVGLLLDTQGLRLQMQQNWPALFEHPREIGVLQGASMATRGGQISPWKDMRAVKGTAPPGLLRGHVQHTSAPAGSFPKRPVLAGQGEQLPADGGFELMGATKSNR